MKQLAAVAVVAALIGSTTTFAATQLEEPPPATAATNSDTKVLKSIDKRLASVDKKLSGGFPTTRTAGGALAKIEDLLDDPGVLSYGGPELSELLYSICLNTLPEGAGATRC